MFFFALQGIPTQRQLDHTLCIVTAVAAIIYGIVISFSYFSLKFYLRSYYLIEMFHRMGYIMGMLHWIGKADFIHENWDAGRFYLQGIPFDLEVVPTASQTASREGFEVLSGYPYKLRGYDPYLEGYVELQEHSMSLNTGCVSDTFFSGFGFFFLCIFFMWTIVKVGNLVARYYPHGKGHTIAMVLVVCGLLSPLVFGVCMEVFLYHSQRNCVILTKKATFQRSINLLGQVSNFASLGLNGDIVNLFNPTMAALNERFITDGNYGIAAVNNYNLVATLFPPIPKAPPNVLTALLERDGDMAETSLFFSDANCFLATFPLTAYNRILVLVSVEAKKVLPASTPSIVASFVFLVVLLGVLFAYTVARFPFPALGHIWLNPAKVQHRKGWENWSPWEWRASPRWPFWKLIHVAALVCLMIGASVVFLSQLVSDYVETNTFADEWMTLLEKNEYLKDLGTMELLNLQDVVFRKVWYAPYVEMLLQQPSLPFTREELARFYIALALGAGREQYEGMSAAGALSTSAVSLFPLLMHTRLSSAIEKAGENESTNATADLYWLYTTQWDTTFLWAMLANDVTVLSNGDAATSSWLRSHAEDIDSTEEAVNTSIALVLEGAVPYRLMASNYSIRIEGDSGSNASVMELMNSAVGRNVMTVEDRVSEVVERASTGLHEQSLLFTWGRFQSFGIVLACLIFGGVCLWFDIFYTAVFFGASLGRPKPPPATTSLLSPSSSLSLLSPPSSAPSTPPKVPTNDRLSASPYFSFSHTTLWRSVHRAYACLIVVTVCTTIAVCVSYVEVEQAVQYLIGSFEANFLSSVDSVKGVFRACPLTSSTAMWTRTLLSLNNTDADLAVWMTHQWNRETLTHFVGTPPESTSISFAEELTVALRSLAALSIVIAERKKVFDDTGQNEVLYMDFLLLLEDWPTFYDFETLVSDNCSASAEEKYIIVQNMFFFFRDMITDGAVFSPLTLNYSITEPLPVPESATLDALEILLPLLDKYAGTCGLSTDLPLYLTRLGTFSTRIWRVPLLIRLVRRVMTNAINSTTALEASLALVKEGLMSNDRSITGTSLPWIAIVFALFCTVFVWLLYGHVTTIHRTLYHCC